jgi:Holliday junction DNA helicase RuvB
MLQPELLLFPGAPRAADPRGSCRRGGDPAGAPAAEGTSAIGSPLRPRDLGEFLGQDRVVGNLELAARTARERGEPLGHLLLYGPPGFGKTTLAALAAREMGARVLTAMGALIAEPHQLVPLLARLRAGDLFFVDEIHRLPPACEECLYSALEDGVIDAVVAGGAGTRTVRIELEPFTLVGATTRPGALSEPFRARFKLQERLDRYSEETLAAVAAQAAPRLGRTLSPEAAVAIARRARRVPREALRLLERARDVAQDARSEEIAAAHVEEAAARLGIDERGLWSEERQILAVLTAHRRPMGIDAIAATAGLDPETVKSIHEPHLIEHGYLRRGLRGREATMKALRHYGNRRPVATVATARDGNRPPLSATP